MREPIGYYADCDRAFCLDCFDPDKWEGFEEWEAPLPIFHDTESDTPTHCDNVKCLELIPHNLTTEGYHYVAEAVSDWLREYNRLENWKRITMGGRQASLLGDYRPKEPWPTKILVQWWDTYGRAELLETQPYDFVETNEEFLDMDLWDCVMELLDAYVDHV